MTDVIEMAKKARKASLRLANMKTDVKNKALHEAAREIRENTAPLQEANRKDLAAAKEKDGNPKQ